MNVKRSDEDWLAVIERCRGAHGHDEGGARRPGKGKADKDCTECTVDHVQLYRLVNAVAVGKRIAGAALRKAMSELGWLEKAHTP